MSTTPWRRLMQAALFSATVAAQAQGTVAPAGAAPAARPDPLNAKASVPAPSYRSAFAGFRGFSESKPANWREANDTVTRVGGWRSYLREAHQPEAPASATDSAASPQPARPVTSPAGHGGHKSP